MGPKRVLFFKSFRFRRGWWTAGVSRRNPPPFSFALTKENGRGRSKENRQDKRPAQRAGLL